MKEIHVDAHRLRPDRLEAVTEWVRSLGVKPEDVRPQFVIVQGEREYELHLSKFVRTEEGKLQLDRARDDVASLPLVMSLGPDPVWPSLEGGIMP
jgi:hypothetical protein